MPTVNELIIMVIVNNYKCNTDNKTISPTTLVLIIEGTFRDEFMSSLAK